MTKFRWIEASGAESNAATEDALPGNATAPYNAGMPNYATSTLICFAAYLTLVVFGCATGQSETKAPSGKTQTLETIPFDGAEAYPVFYGVAIRRNADGIELR